MNIRNKLIPVNRYNRPATAQTPKKICVHYTGDPAASADQLCAYYGNVARGLFKSNPSAWTSAHYVIGINGEQRRVIPDNEIAYAASGNNQDVLHIEVCHADSTGKFSEEAITSLAEVVRYLMQLHKIPAENVVRHYDLTGKLCPMYYVDSTRWAALHERITSDNTAKPLYRVQVGAFRSKSNAEAYLKKVKEAGFAGFITEVTD